MYRRFVLALGVAASVILATALFLHHNARPVLAQSNSQALTLYALTVYSGPDRSHAIIGVLIPHAKIIMEKRSADAGWVLGRSTDGLVRGWMESRFLQVSPGDSIVALLVGTETMFVPDHVIRPPGKMNITLYDYPILPAHMGQARAIFERGQITGAQATHISKIGDCISDNEHFLSPFGWGRYDLGDYTQLQGVVTQYSESLTYDSLAAYNGLVTSAVLDPLFSNPLACEPGETPLRCELRVHQPSVAVIMFGAQDLLFTAPQDFDTNLRRIVHETIEAGVIPLLSTFPGNLDLWEEAVYYNQIVVQIALDYDIPLMNLWRALDALPNHGLNDDGRHLSLPITTSGDLSTTNLTRGYPLRNLVTLQALDAVWQTIASPR